MEEELVSVSSMGGNASASPLSVSTIFDEHLPYYLAMGMSYNLYWRGDCAAVIAYRRAYELERRRTERDLWRQGLYVYEALLDCTPVLHAFAGRGAKPLPYPSEPHPATLKDAQEAEERHKREEYEKQKATIEQWARDVQRLRQRKEDGNNG